MADFSQNIQSFQRYGVYDYKFDDVGNLTFDSSSSDFSRVYVAFPLRNPIYNNTKIQTFYDPTFTEFVPSAKEITSADVEGIQQQVDVLTEENTALKSQLDTLTAQSDTNSSGADQLATKQVILELRKALGQGRVDSDFSEDFPYAPIRKVTGLTSDTATQVTSTSVMTPPKTGVVGGGKVSSQTSTGGSSSQTSTGGSSSGGTSGGNAGGSTGGSTVIPKPDRDQGGRVIRIGNAGGFIRTNPN